TETWSNVTGGTGTQAGAIGTTITRSLAQTTNVSAPLGGTPILNQRISTTISLTDSVVDYPSRDSYGIAITNSSGISIGSITLDPVSQTLGSGWTVSYTTSTGKVTAAGSIVAGSEYNFSLTFLATGVE